MATFSNTASLAYNGMVRTSNTTIGELVDALAINKTSVSDNYYANGRVTYSVTITNSGTAPFTDITFTDNLGAYTFGTQTLVPYNYEDGSLQYYVDGVLQATPTIEAGPPLRVSGINVPAGGNALLVYEVSTNAYAPLDTTGTITNTASIQGAGLAAPISDSDTIPVRQAPDLTITKMMSPTTVTENGTITYTVTIQNYGNVEASDATGNNSVILSDTFNPVLEPVSTTLDGNQISRTGQYTYDSTTGEFATTAGTITVPAATYTQDPVTGIWSTNPGVTTIEVTGTI